jgi:hypothetical protein
MTMHKLIKTTVFGLALTLAACGGEPKDAGAKGGAKKDPKAANQTPDADPGEQVDIPALDPKVEQAVSLANKISAKPEAADTILEEAGMNREAFETLLYEIARDPEMSKSYAVAREA